MANHESSFEWSVAEQLQRRSAMKLLALLACAACTAPIEATVEQPGTMLIHDTPWFRIHFYEAPHEEAPLPNCPVPIDTRCYASVTGAHLGDIPDYIEDLGVFLEEGLASYRTQGYDLPQSGQIPIYVHLVDEGAGTISFADGGINIDHAMPTMGAWTLPQTLRYTAWHELFHVAQFRAFEGAPPWTHYNSAGRHLWLLEATATDRAFAGAYVPGVFDDA